LGFLNSLIIGLISKFGVKLDSGIIGTLINL